MLDTIAKLLNTSVPNCNATVKSVEVGDSSILVDAPCIFQVCEYLKTCPEYSFNVLQVISGTDFLEEGFIELSYILAGIPHNIELILKTRLNREKNDSTVEIDSVCSLWKAANFLERETFDMLGVFFKGHPDLRRILCPQDWEGYPLRRDYKAQEFYHGLKIYPEDKLNLKDQSFGAEQNASSQSNKTPMGEGRYS
jgi:NADH-quinone oxidoreductase subunit C